MTINAIIEGAFGNETKAERTKSLDRESDCKKGGKQII